MSATLSLIDINWSGGRCTAGATTAVVPTSPPLQLISSSALRVALGLRRWCLADVAVRAAAAAVTMAVAGYGPGRARPMAPLHAALRSASNCEKEVTAEREPRDTRRGLAP